MIRALFVLAMLVCSMSMPVAAHAAVPKQEPVIGGPCENCGDVFIGMPAEIPSVTRIAPVSEPGEPMRIVGTVRNSKGAPVAGVIVYAYHTDDRGIYPRIDATRHGRLRGWARTDADGNYGFDTIRPAGYPDTRIPAHVHMHVIEPGCCTYFIDDIHFTDDPRLPDEDRRDNSARRGGSGLVTPPRDANGVWIARRDIVLGAGIPGYESRAIEAGP